MAGLEQFGVGLDRLVLADSGRLPLTASGQKRTPEK
jgi:hypothetical protein